jgi:hypothetical protein
MIRPATPRPAPRPIASERSASPPLSPPLAPSDDDDDDLSLAIGLGAGLGVAGLIMIGVVTVLIVKWMGAAKAANAAVKDIKVAAEQPPPKLPTSAV